jgi:hypothetical protein
VSLDHCGQANFLYAECQVIVHFFPLSRVGFAHGIVGSASLWESNPELPHQGRAQKYIYSPLWRVILVLTSVPTL